MHFPPKLKIRQAPINHGIERQIQLNYIFFGEGTTGKQKKDILKTKYIHFKSTYVELRLVAGALTWNSKRFVRKCFIMCCRGLWAAVQYLSSHLKLKQCSERCCLLTAIRSFVTNFKLKFSESLIKYSCAHMCLPVFTAHLKHKTCVINFLRAAEMLLFNISFVVLLVLFNDNKNTFVKEDATCSRILMHGCCIIVFCLFMVAWLRKCVKFKNKISSSLALRWGSESIYASTHVPVCCLQLSSSLPSFLTLMLVFHHHHYYQHQQQP